MIEEIKLRKSIRKYKENGLKEEDFNFVEEAIKEAKPLYNNIKTKIIFEKDGERLYKTAKMLIKSLFFIKSPHYLILMSENKEGLLENVGFLGEQIVLKLAKQGIGTCWIGGNVNDKKFAKSYNTEYNLNYVLCIALGYPLEEMKEVKRRKRKDLEEIFENDKYKKHLDAADALRAAPSGSNRQPWFIESGENSWDYYIHKYSGLMKDLKNSLAGVDAGIGLSHILLESNRKGEMVHFEKENKKEKEGFRYITTVKFD